MAHMIAADSLTAWFPNGYDWKNRGEGTQPLPGQPGLRLSPVDCYQATIVSGPWGYMQVIHTVVVSTESSDMFMPGWLTSDLKLPKTVNPCTSTIQQPKNNSRTVGECPTQHRWPYTHASLFRLQIGTQHQGFKGISYHNWISYIHIIL